MHIIKKIVSLNIENEILFNNKRELENKIKYLEIKKLKVLKLN